MTSQTDKPYMNASRAETVSQNMGLVKSIAARFVGRGHELEDLIEVGIMGLLKAIDGYDEALGYRFSTYAFPLITGEIKRFLRDDGPIKVSRSIKKNAYIVMKAKEEYIKQYGKEPRISRLCEACNLSAEDVTQALSASSPLLSLQESIGGDNGTITLSDIIPDDDKISGLTERMALEQAIESLDGFERKLIDLRYYRNLTQAKTASIMGITQVKVSRCEKKILKKLRDAVH